VRHREAGIWLSGRLLRVLFCKTALPATWIVGLYKRKSARAQLGKEILQEARFCNLVQEGSQSKEVQRVEVRIAVLDHRGSFGRWRKELAPC
jgi:hypothetical protein